LLVGALAALLTLPWVNFVLAWRSWPAWLLLVPVYLLFVWLLERLGEPTRIRDLETRVAALEEREAIRRASTRRWSGDPEP
jgi:hypothetical protein